MFIEEGHYVVVKKEANMKVLQVTRNKFVSIPSSMLCAWMKKRADTGRLTPIAHGQTLTVTLIQTLLPVMCFFRVFVIFTYGRWALS